MKYESQIPFKAHELTSNITGIPRICSVNYIYTTFFIYPAWNYKIRAGTCLVFHWKTRQVQTMHALGLGFFLG